MEVYRQALAAIHDLVEEAKRASLPDAAVMALATAGETGAPSVRNVYLAAVIDDGLVFFSHSASRKAAQMKVNPRAAACLYWHSLARQVQVEGGVRRLDEADADTYWRQRDRDSQLLAWAAEEPESTQSDDSLENRLVEFRKQFDFQRRVPRPQQWAGYCLSPERIELWATSWRRPRQRTRYQKTPDGWVITHLDP